jgi:hypothetical protein
MFNTSANDSTEKQQPVIWMMRGCSNRSPNEAARSEGPEAY